MTAYQLNVQTYESGTNRQLPVDRIGSYIFIGDNIIDTDEDLSNIVGTGIGKLNAPTAAEVAAQGGADSTVTPIADAAAANETGYGVVLEPAEDAVPDITFDTSVIALTSSTTGTKVITTSSANAGQTIDIRLIVATGGSYTLAVTDGALTFNATAEYARITRNAADTAWTHLLLSGATIV